MSRILTEVALAAGLMLTASMRAVPQAPTKDPAPDAARHRGEAPAAAGAKDKGHRDPSPAPAPSDCTWEMDPGTLEKVSSTLLSGAQAIAFEQQRLIVMAGEATASGRGAEAQSYIRKAVGFGQAANFTAELRKDLNEGQHLVCANSQPRGKDRGAVERRLLHEQREACTWGLAELIERGTPLIMFAGADGDGVILQFPRACAPVTQRLEMQDEMEERWRRQNEKATPMPSWRSPLSLKQAAAAKP
ncbi:MAG: hypothetical protein M3N08_07625 [Pseudomonadota bacterium]|nr:hypothetical protein [Pseudomonadota bacterium]